MVLDQVFLLGLAGLDAYALAKYVQSRRQLGASSSAAPAVSASPLSSRLEAIKAAVGTADDGDEVLAVETGSPSKPSTEPTASSETADSIESLDFLPDASLAQKLEAVIRELESHSAKIQKLDSTFSSAHARLDALERRFSRKQDAPSIRITAAKKPAKRLRAE